MNVSKMGEDYGEAETIKRSEAALKRMLSTPPTRHNKSKVSRKAKAKKGRPAKLK